MGIFFPGFRSRQKLNAQRLSKTQRLLLEYFSVRKLETASSAARDLFFEEKLPESSYWFSLRKLKKIGLVEFGQALPVRVTRLGDVCVQILLKNMEVIE